MGIVKYMRRALRFGLNYTAAISGLTVLFYCGSLWGYFPDYHQESAPGLLPKIIEDPFSHKELISKKDKKKKEGGTYNQQNQRWQDLSPEEKDKIRQKYQEWQSLPAEEKQIIRQRMNQLKRMPPQKRNLYQQLFQQWQHISPDERKQLQKDLDNWEGLSPRQKELIRQRFTD